jgi:hypothetical protein
MSEIARHVVFLSLVSNTATPIVESSTVMRLGPGMYHQPEYPSRIHYAICTNHFQAPLSSQVVRGASLLLSVSHVLQQNSEMP